MPGYCLWNRGPPSWLGRAGSSVGSGHYYHGSLNCCPAFGTDRACLIGQTVPWRLTIGHRWHWEELRLQLVAHGFPNLSEFENCSWPAGAGLSRPTFPGFPPFPRASCHYSYWPAPSATRSFWYAATTVLACPTGTSVVPVADGLTTFTHQ